MQVTGDPGALFGHSDPGQVVPVLLGRDRLVAPCPGSSTEQPHASEDQGVEGVVRTVVEPLARELASEHEAEAHEGPSLVALGPHGVGTDQEHHQGPQCVGRGPGQQSLSHRKDGDETGHRDREPAARSHRRGAHHGDRQGDRERSFLDLSGDQPAHGEHAQGGGQHAVGDRQAAERTRKQQPAHAGMLGPVTVAPGQHRG